jgi:hypothetical protein
VVCEVGETVTDTVSSVTLAPLKALAESTVAGATELWREWVATGWTKVPTPNLADASSPAWTVRGHLLWLTSFVLLLCIIAVCVRLVIVRRREPLMDLLRGIITTVLVVAGSVSLVGLLLRFSDEYSTWIITSSTPFDPSWTTGPVNWIVMSVTSLFVVVFGVVQILLLVIRSAVIVLFVGLLPVAAAASGTNWGRQWFEKLAGWTFAFIIYKPVAATIYATGFAMMNDSGNFMTLLGGAAMSILAVVALPALIKLSVPATAGLVGGGSGGGMIASGAMAMGAIRAGSSSTVSSATAAPAAVPAGAAASVAQGVWQSGTGGSATTGGAHP